MSNRAWVTLATNDSYGLGALVLAYSLRRVGSAYPTVVLITPAVTESMRNRLHAVFAEVITVDVLDSRDATHLALLQRPELGITFTKIHCWNLTQYEKCVFLDADTLVVQNSDELFEREELSAAPDVGWPDCFNSGVFVYKPSKETFDALIKFGQERGSFDGGDQGLLNSYFSDWAHSDITKHLPFVYNVTSAAFYSYLPALKHFGQNLKIIHFIGANKPWLQPFNWESRSVEAPSHLQALLQLWWDLFVSSVHPQLDTAMVVVEGPPAIPPPDITQHYQPNMDPHSEFSWHHPQSHQRQETNLHIDSTHFHDPWESYKGNVPAPDNVVNAEHFNDHNRDVRNYAWEYRQEHLEQNTNVLTHASSIWQPPSQTEHHHKQNQGQLYHENNLQENHGNQSVVHGPSQHLSNYRNDDEQQESHNRPEKIDPQYQLHHYFHEIHENVIVNEHSSNNSHNKDSNWNIRHNIINVTQDILGLPVQRISNSSNNGEGGNNHNEVDYDEDIRPRHPYDGYYLRHQPTIDVRGRKICTHELPSTPPPPPPPNTISDYESSPDSQTGVAGNLAKVTPGSPSAQRDAIDELTRRQGWEAGNIDYMGADSFANIWAKISQTLAEPRVSPPKQVSPPREQASVKEPTPPPKQPTPPPKQPTPPPKQPTPPPKQPTPPPKQPQPPPKQPTPPPKQPTPPPKQPTPPPKQPQPPPKQPTPPPKQPTPPPKQASLSKEVQQQEVEASLISTDAVEPTVEVAKGEQEPLAPSVVALTNIPPQESILPDVPVLTTRSIEQTLLDSSVVSEQTVIPEVAAVETTPASQQISDVLVVEAPTTAEVTPTPADVAPTTALVVSTPIETSTVSVETPAATTAASPAPAVTENEIPKPAADTKVVSLVPPQTGVTEDKAVEKSVEVEKTTPPVPATKEAEEKVVVSAESEKVAAAETPIVPIPSEPTPATPVLSSTPDKNLDLTTASTDSPPLANTPAKEEPDTAVQPPTAKSAEGRGKKLHLSAPGAGIADLLPTPDSELEDAAALAQSIIAGELATPTVTSPTPPVPLTPSSPPAPVDKRLSVDDTVLDTPPAGPVSLAQIGVKTKGKVSTAEQIAASIDKPQETNPEDAATPSTPTEPTTPVKEEAAPKKKVVKKVVKKEGEAGPVPPPRKKEKKPK